MEFQYINCPTNDLDIQDLMGMVLHKGYLIINQQRFISVWDASNPENLQKISEFPFPKRRNGMRLFGDELYVWGKWLREKESHVHILDVSDPLNITQKREIILQDESVKINGLYASNGKIFAVGYESGIIEIQNDGTIITLLEWDQSINDLVVYESLLITKGASRGFDGTALFELGNNGLTGIKDIPAQFVIPSNIEWLEEGKSVLLLGEFEDVLKMDVSDPAKAKRVKAAKTGIGLSKQFAREGDNIYVLGTAIESRTHAPVVCVVDVSGESPELKYKQIIKEYLQKSVGSDKARGIVRTGDYLILATYHCQLGVIKIS